MLSFSMTLRSCLLSEYCPYAPPCHISVSGPCQPPCDTTHLQVCHSKASTPLPSDIRQYNGYVLVAVIKHATKQLAVERSALAHSFRTQSSHGREGSMAGVRGGCSHCIHSREGGRCSSFHAGSETTERSNPQLGCVAESVTFLLL